MKMLFLVNTLENDDISLFFTSADLSHPSFLLKKIFQELFFMHLIQEMKALKAGQLFIILLSSTWGLCLLDLSPLGPVCSYEIFFNSNSVRVKRGNMIKKLDSLRLD